MLTYIELTQEWIRLHHSYLVGRLEGLLVGRSVG
jgi:hypothetical protein